MSLDLELLQKVKAGELSPEQALAEMEQSAKEFNSTVPPTFVGELKSLGLEDTNLPAEEAVVATEAEAPETDEINEATLPEDVEVDEMVPTTDEVGIGEVEAVEAVEPVVEGETLTTEEAVEGEIV